MGHTHLSDDELIDRVYGLGGAGPEGCPQCEERWRRVGARRQQVTEAPDVPLYLLAAERRKVLDRIERSTNPAAWRRILAPAAVAAMIAVSVGLQMPAPRPQPTIASAQPTEDRVLFEQVFRDMTRTEPQSLAAVRNLFEGKR